MNFQNIVFLLQKFWSTHGCAILYSIDTEVGAATSHYLTTLHALDKKPSQVVYLQPCRRPSDGRYVNNPNRIQHYYQLQVLLKPSLDNMQYLVMNSMRYIGLSSCSYDVKFIDSEWANPTLGACGSGWEVWCNGIEIIQGTYMQQVGGISCSVILGEITYGLERLASIIQNKKSIWDIIWNDKGDSYKDFYYRHEMEYCKFNFDFANVGILKRVFTDYEVMSQELLSKGLVYPSYDYCLKASHIFNILEARGVFSTTERLAYIKKLSFLSRSCCLYYKNNITH